MKVQYEAFFKMTITPDKFLFSDQGDEVCLFYKIPPIHVSHFLYLQVHPFMTKGRGGSRLWDTETDVDKGFLFTSPPVLLFLSLTYDF